MSHIPNPLVRPVVGSAVVALLFALSFLGALHAPRPNDLPVGLTGPPAAVAAVQDQLDQRAPGAFAVTRYPDEAAARTAVHEREVDGAFVAGAGTPTLLVAGAAGTTTRTTLVETFTAAAGAGGGGQLQVLDVQPLPAADRAGISSFLFVVTVLVPSVVGAALVAGLGRRSAPAGRAVAALAAAAAIGLLNAWVLTGVYGALTGAYLQVAGTAALLSAAVSLPALALHRLLGTPGLALAGLLFVVFGMPATGGAIGPSFIPDAYAAASALLPGGAALEAVRSTAYFEGAPVAGPLWTLAAWAVAGAAALLVPVRGDRRRHPGRGAARASGPAPAAA